MERVVAPELRWYEINNGDAERLFACRAGAAAPPPNGAEKLPLLGYSSQVAAPDWTLLPEEVVKVLLQQLPLLSHSLSALEQTHRLFSSALVQAEAARRIQLRERARDQGAVGSLEPWIRGRLDGCMRVPPRLRGERNRKLQRCWEPWTQMLRELEHWSIPDARARGASGRKRSFDIGSTQ